MAIPWGRSHITVTFDGQCYAGMTLLYLYVVSVKLDPWLYYSWFRLFFRHCQCRIFSILNFQDFWLWNSGCKESQFYSLPFRQAVPSMYLPESHFNYSEKKIDEQDWLQFFCNLNSSQKVTHWSGKLRTEFTSLIAKSTSPRLSDTTFFACCFLQLKLAWRKPHN